MCVCVCRVRERCASIIINNIIWIILRFCKKKKTFLWQKIYHRKRMPFFGKCGCSRSNRAKLREISVLTYSHSNLVHVPEEIILHERTLEELYLDSNRISELPRVNQNLSHRLPVDSNWVCTARFKWLFQCHGLRTLYLADNELQKLSPAIGSLVNLEHLDISKNGIQDLPDSIKNCKKLGVVEASVNPLGRWVYLKSSSLSKKFIFFRHFLFKIARGFHHVDPPQWALFEWHVSWVFARQLWPVSGNLFWLYYFEISWSVCMSKTLQT